MQYTTIFLDTETTGNGLNDCLCQLCFRAWSGDQLIREHNALYMPTHTISVGSQAVHHITPKMVQDKPLFTESPEYADIKKLLESQDSVIIAHNAPFDMTMLTHESIKVNHFIDTLKLIRHLDSNMEMERHNLQYSRYYLELDEHLPPGTVIQAHDALGDVLILEHLYHYLYKKLKEKYNDLSDTEFIEKLFTISSEPAMMVKFTFGKHVGKLVADVAKSDPGYLRWLLESKQKAQAEEGKDESDWIFTIQTLLGISPQKSMF